MGIIERIKEIEFEMARTQKNKATDIHFISCTMFNVFLNLQSLKHFHLQTAFWSSALLVGSSGAGEGFEVSKFGHGCVALIGFPRLNEADILGWSHFMPT